MGRPVFSSRSPAPQQRPRDMVAAPETITSTSRPSVTVQRTPGRATLTSLREHVAQPGYWAGLSERAAVRDVTTSAVRLREHTRDALGRANELLDSLTPMAAAVDEVEDRHANRDSFQAALQDISGSEDSEPEVPFVPRPRPLSRDDRLAEVRRLAGITSESATTRTARVSLSSSSDEEASRSERLQRMRERLASLRQMAAEMEPSHREATERLRDMAATPIPVRVNLPPISRADALAAEPSAPPRGSTSLPALPPIDYAAALASEPPATARGLSTPPAAAASTDNTHLFANTRHVAEQLERIAFRLRTDALSAATEGVNQTLEDAAHALREVDALLPNRPPFSAVASPSRPPRTHTGSQTRRQPVPPNLAAAAAAPPNPWLSLPRMEGFPERQTSILTPEAEAGQAARLATARARVAAYRYRQSRQHDSNGGQSGGATYFGGNIVVGGRDDGEDVLVDYVPLVDVRTSREERQQSMREYARSGSAGSTSRPGQRILPNAEARHRARGYHREDANGDPIDSDNEEAFAPMVGANALTRLWRQNERMRPQRRSGSKTSAEMEDTVAALPIVVSRPGLVGR